jgi:hypothetical protein
MRQDIIIAEPPITQEPLLAHNTHPPSDVNDDTPSIFDNGDMDPDESDFDEDDDAPDSALTQMHLQKDERAISTLLENEVSI